MGLRLKCKPYEFKDLSAYCGADMERGKIK